MFSEFSAFSAMLFFSLYTVICCFLCRKVGWRTLKAFGIGLGLLLMRCLLPFEIPGVQPIRITGWYADIYLWLNPYFAEGITPLDVLLIIWVAGSLLFLLHLVYRLSWQCTAVKRDAVGTDHRLSRICQEVLREMSCTAVGNISISAGYPTPMMAGFFKPHILFPLEMADLSEEELKFIFRHEITHFKNRDLWIKLLVELLCCALWWNPVVYMLRICISQLLEMRCDSQVCEKLDEYQQLEYSQTLLNSFKKSARRSVFVTAEYLGYPSKDRLKQRFMQILHASSQPKKKGLSILIVTLAICAFVSSYTVIFLPGVMHEGTGTGYEVDSTSFETSYILRMPDGSLKVYIDHQFYAEITEDELNKEPFSVIPIIDVNISSEED